MVGYTAFLLLASLLLTNATNKKLYHGDKVFRLVPKTPEHLKWLQELRIHADSSIYDFWTVPRALNRPVDIHVDKAFEKKFCTQVEERKMNYSVNVNDLQKFIDDVDAISLQHSLLEARKIVPKPTVNIVGKFARHCDIVIWLNQICATYKTLATCGSVGKTYEGRDIRYIKLGVAAANKKIIVIEGGIHAREWLSHATTIYLTNRLVTTYNTDSTAKRMLDTYDFILVPDVNADGYEYSRTDRMWRKTRSRNKGSKCYGVDPNRNYDMSWGLSGVSTSPCSEIYLGPRPFSEPETKAMSDFLMARKSDILAFFTIHSYAQMWLVPYGDKEGNYPSDFSETLRVAKIGADALMAVNNANWQVGNTVDVLYAASGAGDDWAKSIGIKYSYTLELRPSDYYARSGFVVPESQIEPSGREVWAGITAAVDAMQK